MQNCAWLWFFYIRLLPTVIVITLSNWRALHEKEERRKGGGLTRNRFFLIAFLCSFAYYVFPGYLFPMLTSLSWICWVFPDSVIAQQLGSGLHGLGIGAFGLDWASISSYLGSPLASPWFATANIAVGFVLVTYVITPIAYWLNIYRAKTFPIFSDALFKLDGQHYNISAIIDTDFHLDVKEYEKEGPLYLSIFFALYYGVGFACLTATVVHVFLFHGRLAHSCCLSWIFHFCLVNCIFAALSSLLVYFPASFLIVVIWSVALPSQ